jgi:hypothetical protein
MFRVFDKAMTILVKQKHPNNGNIDLSEPQWGRKVSEAGHFFFFFLVKISFHVKYNFASNSHDWNYPRSFNATPTATTADAAM